MDSHPDPIGLAGGLNLYSYVPNPLTWIDPLGLSACSLSGNTIKKSDGTDLITIPNDAKVRKLTPPEGYSGDYGYEYKWKNSGGTTTTVRIHGIDNTASVGSNASKGWVVRIMDGKKVWTLMVIIIHLEYLKKIVLVIVQLS